MISNYIAEFSEIISKTILTNNSGQDVGTEADSFDAICNKIIEAHENGGTVYLVGNGGSSGIISHSSIDFINACKLRAMPMTDNSILTCLANDYGYENVFSEGLNTMFTSKDVLIAVSSSGNSMNIRNAVDKAKERGGFTITYSGFKEDNPLRKMGDYNFWLNSTNYGKVEIGHALLLHILTDELSRRRMTS